MLDSPLSTFDHRYFFSMIDRDDPQSIPDYFAQNIENFIIRNRGQIEMRDGLTARGSSPSATNLGRGVLKTAAGTLHLVRVVDGAGNTAKFQYSSDGTTWSDIGGSGGSKTTGKLWHMVQANDILYAVNGYDTPVKYDGSTMSTVAGIPNGTAIEWWKNMLWVTGVISIPDRLYYSNAGVPETFGGTDYININLGDVSHNVGLKGMGGTESRLFIGKQQSIWYITGYSTATFALQVLTYEHGVASHESMIQVKNDIWAVDQDGHIRALYRYNDDPFSTIKSSQITQTVAGINRAQLSKASAVFYNNFAMFFVPNAVDEYNSLVLVFDTLANEGKGGWVKFTGWWIAHACVFPLSTPRLFLFDSRTSNGQAYEWTGTSDNGTQIVAIYETKLYDHGFPERQKVWKFAHQLAPVIGNVDFNFYSAVDRYYYTKLTEVNLQGTGNKLLGVTWTLGQDKLGGGGFVKERIPMTSNAAENTGYCVQVKLEAISSSSKIKIRNFTMHYRVKGLH